MLLNYLNQIPSIPTHSLIKIELCNYKLMFRLPCIITDCLARRDTNTIEIYHTLLHVTVRADIYPSI